MDKQKEIKEMIKKIDEFCPDVDGECDENYYSDCLANFLVNAGYRLCGGDSCPNFKHYQAECERCTKKMEIKKAFEIDAIKQQQEEEIMDLTAKLEAAEQDKANLERTIEEMNEVLSANGISIDGDGNVVDNKSKQAVKEFADRLMGVMKGMYIQGYTGEEVRAKAINITDKLVKEVCGE